MDLHLDTRQQTELIDITGKVQSVVSASGLHNGLCLVFVPHTTAAVTLNENADPSVPADMLMVLNRIIPWKGEYQHLEGNSAAHLKATLVGASELIAIQEGRLVLGTWQGIFFCEFDGPRKRKVHIHLMEGVLNGR